MDEQKRLLLAVLLSVVVLVGYQFFLSLHRRLTPILPRPPGNPVKRNLFRHPGIPGLPCPTIRLMKPGHRVPSTGPCQRISGPLPCLRRCMTLPYPNTWQR